MKKRRSYELNVRTCIDALILISIMYWICGIKVPGTAYEVTDGWYLITTNTTSGLPRLSP